MILLLNKIIIVIFLTGKIIIVREKGDTCYVSCYYYVGILFQHIFGSVYRSEHGLSQTPSIAEAAPSVIFATSTGQWSEVPDPIDIC